MDTNKVFVPPIKCQGIKTKLVPFIKETIQRDPHGIWIEPFVGSGAVLFNVAPQRAICSDKNQYIIALYKKIQQGEITGKTARAFLSYHGEQLSKYGAAYYIEMRNLFNQNGDPMYFLFLNRSDFNGMIRFNRRGEFNVPFCQKPDRFSKAYISKICNQIDNAALIMEGKDWEFVCCDWRNSMEKAQTNDFVYLDPPYIGRDTSYVGEWPEAEAIALSEYAKASPANVGLSMWKENEFRKNQHLFDCWDGFTFYEANHFYHLGAKESNRHPMVEVLAIKN